ncbi:MAG: phosphatase PAP2 family protein, partial [Myxococcota bacterium]
QAGSTSVEPPADASLPPPQLTSQASAEGPEAEPSASAAQPIETFEAAPPPLALPPVPEIPPLHGPEASSGTLTPSWVDYALWYGPEWAFVVSVAAFEFFDVGAALPPQPALFGPRIDPASPDSSVLQDPRLDALIGRPYLRETVPALALGGTGLILLGSAGVTDFWRRGDFHRSHSLLLGGLTAVTASALVTSTLKVTIGRLRPDFRDRYEAAACQGLTARAALVTCAANPSFQISASEYRDGFRSFPSGHSTAAFAFATYLSLWLGSAFIVPPDAGAASSAAAAAGIGALYAGALFTAATRLSDNRHHPEDVVVGAAVGASMAAAAWSLHFDRGGEARHRWIEWAPGPGDAGIALRGGF